MTRFVCFSTPKRCVTRSEPPAGNPHKMTEVSTQKQLQPKTVSPSGRCHAQPHWHCDNVNKFVCTISRHLPPGSTMCGPDSSLRSELCETVIYSLLMGTGSTRETDLERTLTKWSQPHASGTAAGLISQRSPQAVQKNKTTPREAITTTPVRGGVGVSE